MVQSIQAGTAEDFRRKYRNVDLFSWTISSLSQENLQTQEEFFHTSTTFYEAGNQIVITSDGLLWTWSNWTTGSAPGFEGGLMADVSPPIWKRAWPSIRNKAAQLGMLLSDEVWNTSRKHHGKHPPDRGRREAPHRLPRNP
jgi:chromosomal replication initiator protein